MDEKWQFYIQGPTDTTRNPISGEFFSTEAVGGVPESLVREGIQNAMDARRDVAGTRQPVSVRIFASGQAGAVGARIAENWFAGLRPHLGATGNGLRDVPGPEEPCPFLVFEDFGTIGLNGDPEQFRVLENKTNHFLNFFRAEGHSDKAGDDRGSWGVGKTVFPRASRISSFLSLTIRSDDGNAMLFGRSIIKYHKVGGEYFKSDGYFGLERRGGLMVPTSDPELIEKLRSDFSLERRGETGLSIVIPWYQPECEQEETTRSLEEAILRGFFYPILMGDLVVTVADPSSKAVISSQTVLDRIESMGGDLSNTLLPMAKLAEWANNRTSSDFLDLTAPPADCKPNWSAGVVPEDVAGRIRAILAGGHPAAIRIPTSVLPRGKDPQPTYFDLFIEKSDGDGEKPTFIRDGLIITDVKAPIAPRTRALVVVKDRPLASFLRDAETPAHTQWNQGTSKFKDRYKFGPAGIDFVSRSATELLRILNREEKKQDVGITVDYFSIPKTSDRDDVVPSRHAKSSVGPSISPILPDIPPGRRPPKIRIENLQGGFSIRNGDVRGPLPSLVEVRVAYDVRRGDPLKKYHKADFQIQSDPIVRKCEHVEVREAADNRLLLAPRSADFFFKATGFDCDRDLFVSAKVKETTNDD